MTSAGSGARPSSRAREVTEPSVMPQGTIPVKWERSGATLRAKPWRVAFDGTADRAEFPVAEPNSGFSLAPGGGEAEGADGVDENLFEHPEGGGRGIGRG